MPEIPGENCGGGYLLRAEVGAQGPSTGRIPVAILIRSDNFESCRPF